MRIHEAARTVGCTQRAIKFYEEKGLLPAVSRSENGYRDYSEADIRTLHEIQAYRKLGIGLSDIRRLLNGEAETLLPAILAQKRAELDVRQQDISALEAYIAVHDPLAFDEAVDYESVAQAMRSQFPGFLGAYFTSHFSPYLNIRITTEEQRDAYAHILAFWDDPGPKLPWLFRLGMLLSRLGRPNVKSFEEMDAQIHAMLNPSEEAYARIRETTRKAVLARRSPLVRYSLPEILRRRMMRGLKDCGYYDLFIPQMKRLSPAYCAYHDALFALNDRLCQDLGLHYDSNYNLVL